MEDGGICSKPPAAGAHSEQWLSPVKPHSEPPQAPFKFTAATPLPLCLGCHINTAWPQKPLSQTRVTHPTEWPRDTTGTRAEPRPAPLHAKPTQPADPPRAALQLLSAAQPGPNGQMGFLAYSLCLVSSFMKSDLKAIYWRGYSECTWTRGMSTQKSTSAACWSTCL